ncbi:MAG: hypothetical protein ACFFE8_11350 [Candidatus Heimdallarchaeota archaeon]
MGKKLLVPIIMMFMFTPISFLSADPTYVETASEIPSIKIDWNRTYGGAGDQSGYAMIQTVDGGFAIAGQSLSSGMNGSQVMVVKTNASGHEQWNYRFGGNQVIGESANGLTQTSDGGFVLTGWTVSLAVQNETTDSYTGDVLLVKIDGSGKEVWKRTFGGTDWDWANEIIETVDGGFLLGGCTNSYGAGEADFWIIKTDSNGLEEWNYTLGGPTRDFCDSLIETRDRGFALSGSSGDDLWLVKVDASVNQQWDQRLGGGNRDIGTSVIQTEEGGFVVAGVISGNFDYRDAWLVKIDSSGNVEWSQTYGDSPVAEAHSVIQTADGGFAFAGYSQEDVDVYADTDLYVVKTDASGSEEWNYTVGGTGEAFGRSIVQTANGTFVIGGSRSSNSNTDTDMWLIKVTLIPRSSVSTNLPGHFFILSAGILALVRRKRLK